MICCMSLYMSSAVVERDLGISFPGLAAFSDKTLLSQALNFSIGSCVRSQDSVHLIGSIAKNRAGRDISWQFFKENFQLLKGR